MLLTYIGKRAKGDMYEQLKDPFNPKYADTWKVASNELIWLVRHAGVESTVIVDRNGNITVNHILTDQFDLRPSSGRTGAYNNANKVLGTAYHDIVGGNDKLIIKSKWTSKR